MINFVKLMKLYSLFLITLIPLLLIPAYAQESNTIRLNPTDDTFILANYFDPDNIENMQEKPLGNIDAITSWYSWDYAPEKRILATIFLKFDLKDISSNEIDSAKLLLFAYKTIEKNPSSIAIFSLDKTSWSEKDLTYDTGIKISQKISDATMITLPGLYEWDVTQFIIDNAGTEIAIAANFDTINSGSVSRVSFVSKESSDSNNHPVLVIETSTSNSVKEIQTQEDKITELERRLGLLEKELIDLKQSQNIRDEKNSSNYTDYRIIKMTPTDDAFVITNLSDPDDVKGAQITNTGTLDFLKSWYAWNVTEDQEKMLTNSYLKFNLSKLDSDKVISAQLTLTPIIAKSSLGTVPYLELTKADTNWNESEITFVNKPSYDEENSIVNTIITNPNNEQGLYTWDITDLVTQNAGSKLSVVFFNNNIVDSTEEMVSFHSKETEDQNNAPVLEIKYSLDDSTNNTMTEGGGCLIATATFGSELSPQVQFLREIRDTQLMNTDSGISFMSSFNQFYYSFSPYIADMERDSPIFKEAVKIGITPLLSSLSIMSHADSESKVLGYGIGVILMNVGMYFMAPVLIIMKILSFHKHKKN